MEKNTSAAANVVLVAFDFRIKVQVSETVSKGLSAALQDTKTTLADHLAMVKEKNALADTARSKLQDELRR